MPFYTLDEVIRSILEDPNSKLSTAAINALHGATSAHPWGEGKPEAQRITEVQYAIAGHHVHAEFRRRLRRLSEALPVAA